MTLNIVCVERKPFRVESEVTIEVSDCFYKNNPLFYREVNFEKNHATKMYGENGYYLKN